MTIQSLTTTIGGFEEGMDKKEIIIPSGMSVSSRARGSSTTSSLQDDVSSVRQHMMRNRLQTRMNDDTGSLSRTSRTRHNLIDRDKKDVYTRGLRTHLYYAICWGKTTYCVSSSVFAVHRLN